MYSVTNRIKDIKQPRGGFLPMKAFEKRTYDDGNTLGDENITPGLVGLAIDYLTRFMLGEKVYQAFAISTKGAEKIGKEKIAKELISEINGLDEKSIIAACKLVGFDVCFRVSVKAYRPIENICPDESTIKNIQIMVGRCVAFFDAYGPVITDSFTFEGGGYTETVSSGDGDYITYDTLWDIKVIKNSPTSNHSLQILMYYIMGIHSKQSLFQNVKYIGIFNPRLNIVYRVPVCDIPYETIRIVEDDVICYGKKLNVNSIPQLKNEVVKSPKDNSIE